MVNPKPKQAQPRHDRVEKDLLPPGGRENRGVVLKMMLSRDTGRVGDCLGRPVESWEGHIPAHKCSAGRKEDFGSVLQRNLPLKNASLAYSLMLVPSPAGLLLENVTIFVFSLSEGRSALQLSLRMASASG